MRISQLALLLAPVALAACASGPRPQFERGWIGGKFADVSRERRLDGRGVVIGMPLAVPGDCGALVTAAAEGTPLARAGLAPGDLVLAVDGKPAEDAQELREQVETLTPGVRARATYWRGGQVHDAEIVVGRETYESAGTVQIALPLSLHLDLWPFDDGIDIFGLVRVQWDERRHDLATAENAYRKAVEPDEPIVSPQQESLEIFVIPFGAAKGVRVLQQETLP